MKTKLVVMILAFGVLCFSTAAAHAVPLPADMSGYYKFGYFDDNTYAAKVEMGVGAIKAHVLNDPDTLHLGVIDGDRIIFISAFNEPQWGVATQVDEETVLVAVYNADTGEVRELTALKITEEEALEITEENRRKENSDSCVNNLKQIGLMLHLFARDHENELPYSLDELYPEYARDRYIFVCPEHGGGFQDYEQDYEYIPGFRVDSPNPDEEAVVIEVEGNHVGTASYYHILYLDGHVEVKIQTFE